MHLILVGPGRAGLALGARLVDAGHVISGVLARTPQRGEAAAERLGSRLLSWDEDLPTADLLICAVSDDAIAGVAARLADRVSQVDAAVHLSGLVPVSALEALNGPALGGFHPLQTMPTSDGAKLDGAWVGITSDDDALVRRLDDLARSVGLRPFRLEDDVKAIYHAGAAAAANFVITSLALSERLFAAAGVPFAAAAPLVRAVVDNALEMGPAAALTGPIARGDVGTVRAQVDAIMRLDAALAAQFKAFGRATADLAGTSELFEEILS